MKPINLNIEDNVEESNCDVIPAKLHDESGQVYKDVLYSMYTISSEVIGTEIAVNIMASNLIKHTAANGIKGYWVGIGINKEILNNSVIFTGWGSPIDTELVEPTQPDGEQAEDGKLYGTFYFNAETSKKFGNKAYVVVNKNGVHYHFNIDFSQVSMVTEQEHLEEVAWTQTSVDNLKDNYLFGIDLSDPSGNPLPEGLFVHYLNSAIDYLQNLLDITISDTEFVAERHDYIRSDYQNWGFIQLSHNPVKQVKAIRMMYGNRPSIEIPLDWVQLNKLTGQITLFPSAGSASNLIIGQTGMLFGFQSQWDYAPSLWEVDYEAGIDEKDPTMPLELLKEALYKRASCGILNVWGDLIIGAGIASQSVSIDGISQSIGTTQSAMYGGASARVDAYTKDLTEGILPVLRQRFGGMRMVVV